MLRKIYEFIDKRIINNPSVHLFSIATLWLIFLFFFIFQGFIDTTPATKEEYSPLIKQQQQIAVNFNTIYSYDNYTISPNEDNIEVTLSNDQCKLVCSFDKNLKYLNYEKIDNASSKFYSLFVYLIAAFIIGGGIAIILTIALPTVLFILLILLEKICKLLI